MVDTKKERKGKDKKRERDKRNDRVNLVRQTWYLSYDINI